VGRRPFRLGCTLRTPLSLSGAAALFGGDRSVKIAKLAAKAAGSANKSVRGAALSAICNLAVTASDSTSSFLAFELATSIAATAAAAAARSDADAVKKAFVALGTLALAGKQTQVASVSLDPTLLESARASCGDVVAEVDKAAGGLS
jgi:hypothetical protein